MFKYIRLFFGHPSVRFTILVFTLIIMLNLWEGMTANQRLDADLKEALQSQSYVNIKVTLPFIPERFHMEKFHNLGVVTNAQGNIVFINRVKSKEVQNLARQYWVGHISLNK